MSTCTHNEHPCLASLSLNSRVALVTGAAGGIGSAVAALLAEHGADVALTDIASSASALEEVAVRIRALGRRSFVQVADVARKADVDALVAATKAGLGVVDVLVNVAGIHRYPTRLIEVAESDWNRMLAINLTGPLFVSQAVLPDMVTRNTGCIVNIASDSAFDVIAGEGPYGISKIGLVRLSAYLAKELAGTAVRVNSIAPGWVKTGMSKAFWSDPSIASEAIAGIPARRFAEPVDIANAVLFMVSDGASYVNGHCLVVDGGRIAGNPA